MTLRFCFIFLMATDEIVEELDVYFSKKEELGAQARPPLSKRLKFCIFLVVRFAASFENGIQSI